MKSFLLIVTLLTACRLSAQQPDHVYRDHIATVKLYVAGNPLAYPIWKLNSNETLELHFDDLDPVVRNYSYTYQLCNVDWTPAILSQFDYIQGFSQQRITTYRNSSIAYTRYIHYQAVLPDRNCRPSRSGNYLLKVFADGDTSKLIFTRRLLVLEDKAPIAAQIQQPFNGQFFRTHQKIQFNINTTALNLVNAMQQVNVCILQNNRWDNCLFGIRPTFMRPGSLEFNTEEDAVFPGGREWRWLDLRSFRLQSDRVAKVNYAGNKTDVYVVPDQDRSQVRFVYYSDNNGMYFNTTLDNVNPLWQGDYATVHFSYAPPGNTPFAGKEVYVFGELTDYGDGGKGRMTFNEATGRYETTLFLKQGYYDYSYITIEGPPGTARPSFTYTEGNFWDTENTYTILVYYRALGDRADRLVGLTKVNSLTARP